VIVHERQETGEERAILVLVHDRENEERVEPDWPPVLDRKQTQKYEWKLGKVVEVAAEVEGERQEGQGRFPEQPFLPRDQQTTGDKRGRALDP
jgi:hypothetical protein